MRRAATLAALLPLACGHGNSAYPPAWWDAGNTIGVAPGQQCRAGCLGAKATKDGGEGCACMWYSNFTMLTDGVAPSIVGNSSLRTYMDFNFRPLNPQAPDYPVDIYTNHPWRYPGKAPIWSPCGVGGGNPAGCSGGVVRPQWGAQGQCAGGGYPKGPDARYVDFPDVVTTTWKQGQQVEAAWGITANHGGGYSYRLCPTQTAAQPAGLPIDEECFQAHPLSFVGDKQWLQFGNNRSTRAMYGDVQAVQTSDGTWPAGSQWRRNPIPACQGAGSGNTNGRGGGNQTAYPNKGGTWPCSAASFRGGEYEGIAEGPQFTPPGGYPGKYVDQGIYAYGFGNNGDGKGANTGGAMLFSIVDLLQVPADISPGSYVLSFRYDCEQTTQVWSSCASVRILPASSTEADGALIPDGPSGFDLSF